MASVSLGLDSESRPTWGLVVVLVLTLAAETAADWWVSWLQPAPDYHACLHFCDGSVAGFAPDGCECQRDTYWDYPATDPKNRP